MRNFAGLFLFMLVTGFAPADIRVIKSIEQKNIDFFTTDPLGNCYSVNIDEIIKYDVNGAYFSKFSNKTLGKITHIDATNPFKILVFYKDFTRIIFLDNMLGQTGTVINLERLGLEQVLLACTSHNNGIWLYNQQTFEIVRLDQELEPTVKTGNLAQLLGIELAPNFMCQYNNWLYVNNPKTGILVFDVFGAYYKTIPVKELTSFQISDNKLYYYQNGSFNSYNLETIETTQLPLQDTTVQNVRIEKKQLFLHKNNRLDLCIVD